MSLKHIFTGFAAAGTIAAAIHGTTLATPEELPSKPDIKTTKSSFIPIPTQRPKNLTIEDIISKDSFMLPAYGLIPTPRPVWEPAEKVYLKFLDKAAPLGGYVDYCRRVPDDCLRQPQAIEPILLDKKMEKIISSVNRGVNRDVIPMGDKEQYGIDDYWTIPKPKKGTGKLYGDCEDYVLLKRQKLAAMGVPKAAMRLIFVLDTKNEGHAVLSIRTNKGDLILDNLTDEIRLPAQTGYTFRKATTVYKTAEMVELENVKPRKNVGTSFQP